jgi:hypothetical protein
MFASIHFVSRLHTWRTEFLQNFTPGVLSITVPQGAKIINSKWNNNRVSLVQTKYRNTGQNVRLILLETLPVPMYCSPRHTQQTSSMAS